MEHEMLEELRGIRIIASQIAELQRAILVALTKPSAPGYFPGDMIVQGSGILHNTELVVAHAAEELKHEIEG